MKKPKNKRRQRLLDGINERIELPGGLLAGGVHIEMNSNKEVLIDGRCTIVEYTDTMIKLNTQTGIVKINGFSLDIPSLCQTGVEICGTISSIEFTD